LNEATKERRFERRNEGLNEATKERRFERRNEGLNEATSHRTDETQAKEVHTKQTEEGSTEGRKEGRREGRKEGRTDGRMEGITLSKRSKRSERGERSKRSERSERRTRRKRHKRSKRSKRSKRCPTQPRSVSPPPVQCMFVHAVHFLQTVQQTLYTAVHCCSTGCHRADQMECTTRTCIVRSLGCRAQCLIRHAFMALNEGPGYDQHVIAELPSCDLLAMPFQ